MNSRWVIIFVFIFSGVAGLLFSYYKQSHHQPVVPKYIESERVFHHPISFLSALKNDPRAGEKIYTEYCRSCHGSTPIISVHAPRIDDEKAWKKYQYWRLEKLFQVATQGVKAMPARGGCFECSDALLKQTIQYMTDHRSYVKKNK